MLSKVWLTQEKKLFNLGMRTAAETNDPEKVIFNFSDRTLSAAEKSLLAKGLNLSIPPKKLNYGDFLQPFQSFYTSVLKSQTDSLATQKADLISASIKNTFLEYLNSYNPKIEQNLANQNMKPSSLKIMT